MKTKITTIAVALLLFMTNVSFAQCETETEVLYPSVKIGNQTWMAADIIAEKGGFINWESAMNSSVYEKSQGVCPNGWHIPTEEEWTVLSDYLAKNPLFAEQIFDEKQSVFGIHYSGTVNSDNQTLFAGSEAMFWTSTQIGENKAFYVSLTKNGEIHSILADKNEIHMARCIQTSDDKTVTELVPVK